MIIVLLYVRSFFLSVKQSCASANERRQVTQPPFREISKTKLYEMLKSSFRGKKIGRIWKHARCTHDNLQRNDILLKARELEWQTRREKKRRKTKIFFIFWWREKLCWARVDEASLMIVVTYFDFVRKLRVIYIRYQFFTSHNPLRSSSANTCARGSRGSSLSSFFVVITTLQSTEFHPKLTFTQSLEKLLTNNKVYLLSRRGKECGNTWCGFTKRSKQGINDTKTFIWCRVRKAVARKFHLLISIVTFIVKMRFSSKHVE